MSIRETIWHIFRYALSRLLALAVIQAFLYSFVVLFRHPSVINFLPVANIGGYIAILFLCYRNRPGQARVRN